MGARSTKRKANTAARHSSRLLLAPVLAAVVYAAPLVGILTAVWIGLRPGGVAWPILAAAGAGMLACASMSERRVRNDLAGRRGARTGGTATTVLNVRHAVTAKAVGVAERASTDTLDVLSAVATALLAVAVAGLTPVHGPAVGAAAGLVAGWVAARRISAVRGAALRLRMLRRGRVLAIAAIAGVVGGVAAWLADAHGLALGGGWAFLSIPAGGELGVAIAAGLTFAGAAAGGVASAWWAAGQRVKAQLIGPLASTLAVSESVLEATEWQATRDQIVIRGAGRSLPAPLQTTPEALNAKLAAPGGLDGWEAVSVSPTRIHLGPVTSEVESQRHAIATSGGLLDGPLDDLNDPTETVAVDLDLTSAWTRGAATDRPAAEADRNAA